MKIKDMFQKKIDRPIQGVMQIEQNTDEIVVRDLEEYVVTEELKQQFDTFFEYYCKHVQQPTDQPCVWISGDYGSGKSYFLKMLSALLSGRNYGGRTAAAYFEDKLDDRHLIENMQKAAQFRADVIPVNLGDSSYKPNKAAVVSAFMKGFNEMCGFCGAMPWVAELESQMTKDGVYPAFCSRFKELSGKAWETAREDFYFEEEHIVGALADTTEMDSESARNWYNTAETNYSVTYEAFADRVNEYIHIASGSGSKTPSVIFVCDHVDSSLLDNSNLLLSVQALLEALQIRCGGQAWVIAVGQKDLDAVAGRYDKDVLKIRDRFGLFLSLDAVNMDGIIKKMLLAKTEAAVEKLRTLYADRLASLPDPLGHKAHTFDDFADMYPFLPYQLPLLHAVFDSFRTHRWAGVLLPGGPRSLLGAFREVAIQYMDFEEGTLIPFSAFYGAVENFLDLDIRYQISRACDCAGSTNGLLQPCDVEVLKVLFLIKYIPDVLPPDPEHIAAVMLSPVESVRTSLQRLLEQQLIIENGGLFLFQNRQEQDINQKIKAIKVADEAVIERIGNDIFSILLGNDGIFFYGDHYDFALNTYIDHKPWDVRNGELGIHVLTPIYTQGRLSDQELRSLSEKEKNVIVSIKDHQNFIREIRRSLRIEAYIQKLFGKSYTGKAAEIRKQKMDEGEKLVKNCRELIAEALKNADIYVNGRQLNIEKKDPALRIREACRTLVESIYTKLNDIIQYQPAIDDVTDFIRRSFYNQTVLTVRSLMNQFGGIPYGWEKDDIAGIVLDLLNRQEIRLELNGTPVAANDKHAKLYVTDPAFLDRVTVSWQIKMEKELLENARNIAKHVFHGTDIPEEAARLTACLREAAVRELYRHDAHHPGIWQLLEKYDGKCYPGKSVLEKGRTLLERFRDMTDITACFEYLWAEKEALLDYGEAVQQVQYFFENQREIFDKALDMITIYEKNRFFVQEAETVQIVEDMKEIIKLPAPYPMMKRLEELERCFWERYQRILETERRPVRADIQADREAVLCDLESRNLTNQFSDKVQEEYQDLLSRLSGADQIYEVIAMRTESERIRQRFVNEIHK